MAYDLQIGTMTVFMEASSEPDEGKLAVAYVMVNRQHRVADETLAAICFEPHQFSCWNYDGPNMLRLARVSDIDPTLSACEQAMSNAMFGTLPDPTGGAVNYYSTSMRTAPSWASRMTFTVEIGKHRFYK